MSFASNSALFSSILNANWLLFLGCAPPSAGIALTAGNKSIRLHAGSNVFGKVHFAQHLRDNNREDCLNFEMVYIIITHTNSKVLNFHAISSKIIVLTELNVVSFT